MIDLTPATAQNSGEASAASHDYWRSMSGDTYRKLVEGREEAGQEGYRRQEAILSTLVAAEQRRLGRQLDLLEFGCGFGRHAWYLSALQEVDYSGYDFSEEMVAPLRQLAPPKMSPLESHLFVGPDLRSLLGERRFDVVLTVSVLIHNPPGQVPALLDSMAALLRPGGCICLVENQLVPFTVYENNWHRGCWLHRYLDSIGDGWDVHVGHGLVGTHDIYWLRRNGGKPRRLFRLGLPEGGEAGSQPTSEPDLDQLGIPKLKTWAASAERALQAPQDAGAFEAEELLRAEREQLKRRQNFFSLAQGLAALRAANPRPPPFDPRPNAPQPGAAVELDGSSDTHWANPDPRFSRVVHVVHQEWFGIRAAASYLPGHKLIIPAERPIQPAELKRALDLCANTLSKAVVFHGFSDNADHLLHLLRRQADSSTRIFAVWHGSTAQFHHDFEQDSLARLVKLRGQGWLTGLGAVKPHLNVLSEAIDPRVLLNFPPYLGTRQPAARGPLRGAAFIPVPVDWRKNFYTCLFAACHVARLRTVYVTTRFKSPVEFSTGPKVVQLPFLDRWKLFRLIPDVDVIANTTLSECQPMIALEGLAFETPCLTGPLSLGELDTHPYQRMVQVAGVDFLGQVKSALEGVLDLAERAPAELVGLMRDYLTSYRELASQRLGEFLSL